MEHLQIIMDKLALCPPDWGISLYPDRGDPRFVSYRDLSWAAVSATHSFAAQGLTRGSRVFVPFDTSLEVIVSFVALASMGATPISVKPLTRGQSPDEYCAYLHRIQRAHGVHHILDVPGLPRDLAVVRVAMPVPDFTPHGDWPTTPVALDDLAFVQFSSGSTSFPKGVPITHAQLYRQVGMIAELDRRAPGYPSASWLPLYHDMGLVGGLLSCLYGQQCLHLCSPARFLLDPIGWLRMLSRERIRGFAIPNFGIEYLLRAIDDALPEDLEGLAFDALQHIYVGAEPIEPEALQAWVAFMSQRGMPPAAVQPAYGMAEAVLMVTSSRDRVPRTLTARNGMRCVSVGRPLPTVELRIAPVDGSPFGEIQLRGGTVVDAYLGESSPPLRNADGFYATGDLGIIDDGELFILGRLNDRIKLIGETYFAHDMEHVLESVPGVRARRAVVLQSKSELVVLLDVSKVAARRELKIAVRAKLAAHFGFSMPLRNVVFLRPGQIKRTSSGKLQRAAMLELYEAGLLRRHDETERAADVTGLKIEQGGSV